MAGCTGTLIVSLNHRAVTSDSKADMIDWLHSQVCQVYRVNYVSLCLIAQFTGAIQAFVFIHFLLKRVRVVYIFGDADLERLKSSLGLFAQGFKCYRR